MKNALPEYDFSKPITIVRYKSPRFSIIFYSALFSILVLIILALICVHDGKFVIDFVLWRVLVCIPLIVIASFVREMLNELRIYPKQLMAKHRWTIDELMKMTGKDREETERIMSRVFEAAFEIADKNIIKDQAE